LICCAAALIASQRRVADVVSNSTLSDDQDVTGWSNPARRPIRP
jgi:hypothetical protein